MRTLGRDDRNGDRRVAAALASLDSKPDLGTAELPHRAYYDIVSLERI